MLLELYYNTKHIKTKERRGALLFCYDFFSFHPDQSTIGRVFPKKSSGKLKGYDFFSLGLRRLSTFTFLPSMIL